MFWVKRTDLVRQSSRVYCVTNQNATFSTRLMHELGVELHEEVEQCTAWRRSWTTLVWPCMYDRLLLYDCARELLSTVKCMTMRCMTGWSMTVSINSQLNLELWIASPCTLLWTQTSARHVNQTVVHFDIKQLILHKLFRFYEFKLHFHIEQLLPTTIKQLLPTHHFIPHRCFRYSVCIPSSLFNSFAGVVACVYLELVSYFGAFSSSQTN